MSKTGKEDLEINTSLMKEISDRLDEVVATLRQLESGEYKFHVRKVFDYSKQEGLYGMIMGDTSCVVCDVDKQEDKIAIDWLREKLQKEQAELTVKLKEIVKTLT